MKTKEEKQLMQLRYLIKEFYPHANDIYVDDVEERIYFTDLYDGYEMQARIDRDAEEVVFQYQQNEEWYLADTASFEQVNEVNEILIF